MLIGREEEIYQREDAYFSSELMATWMSPIPEFQFFLDNDFRIGFDCK